MAAAKHRAIDLVRRRPLLERKHGELGRQLEEQQENSMSDYVSALDDDIGDDLLRLIFTSCHPVLSTDAQLALTLRLMGGLTTTEIDCAFLVLEPAIAQRIVRAKRTLADAHVPFEVPRGAELSARLANVLQVIYLISTKATRRRLLTTGAAPRCAKTPCASAASSPNFRRRSRRCTASSR